MSLTSLREAARYAGVTAPAIRKWIDEYRLGEMVDGRWHIDKARLDELLEARRRLKVLKASLRSD
jgi:excisionase family DNA binding protein